MTKSSAHQVSDRPVHGHYWAPGRICSYHWRLWITIHCSIGSPFIVPLDHHCKCVWQWLWVSGSCANSMWVQSDFQETISCGWTVHSKCYYSRWSLLLWPSSLLWRLFWWTSLCIHLSHLPTTAITILGSLYPLVPTLVNYRHLSSHLFCSQIVWPSCFPKLHNAFSLKVCQLCKLCRSLSARHFAVCSYITIQQVVTEEMFCHVFICLQIT